VTVMVTVMVTVTVMHPWRRLNDSSHQLRFNNLTAP